MGEALEFVKRGPGEELPSNLRGKDLVKLLTRNFGCGARPGKGDHLVVARFEERNLLRAPVPLHDALKRGTLNAILAELHIPTERFLKIYNM